MLKLKHSRGGFLCGLQSQADALIVALGDAYYKFWTFLENCIEALAFAFLWRGLCMCLKFPAEQNLALSDANLAGYLKLANIGFLESTGFQV